MPTQDIAASANGYAYRNDRSWTCSSDNYGTHLAGRGTGNNTREPIVAGSVYDSARSEITTYRGFLYFDLSSKNWAASSTINSVTLTVTGRTYTAANLIVMAPSVSFTSISSGLYERLGSTLYSTSTSWSTSNIAITLNTAAKSAVNAASSFCIAIISEDDYERRIDCRESFTHISGWRTASITPKITVDYTLAGSGYAETVTGIAASDMTKINGIAKSDINRVIGV